jgi:hypothetical protein
MPVRSSPRHQMTVDLRHQVVPVAQPLGNSEDAPTGSKEHTRIVVGTETTVASSIEVLKTGPPLTADSGGPSGLAADAVRLGT